MSETIVTDQFVTRRARYRFQMQRFMTRANIKARNVAARARRWLLARGRQTASWLRINGSRAWNLGRRGFRRFLRWISSAAGAVSRGVTWLGATAWATVKTLPTVVRRSFGWVLRSISAAGLTTVAVVVGAIVLVGTVILMGTDRYADEVHPRFIKMSQADDEVIVYQPETKAAPVDVVMEPQAESHHWVPSPEEEMDFLHQEWNANIAPALVLGEDEPIIQNLKVDVHAYDELFESAPLDKQVEIATAIWNGLRVTKADARKVSWWYGRVHALTLAFDDTESIANKAENISLMGTKAGREEQFNVMREMLDNARAADPEHWFRVKETRDGFYKQAKIIAAKLRPDLSVGV